MATKFNAAQYKRLLADVMPAPVDTEGEKERLLAAVETLMRKGEGLSPEESALLRLISILVEDFEKRAYQPGDASPLGVLKHLMDANGLKQSDLWELFGSKGIASEVLNGKRGISKTQAKRLAERFNVSPALFI